MPEVLKDKSFTVIAERITKAGKEKCGDSFAAEYLEEEKILLLIVADGVSSSPCDWRASELACETTVTRFRACDGNIAARMKAAAEKAHNMVRQIDGRCAGSITSLTFVAWEIGSDEIYSINVGDSRIYIGQEDDIEQVTVDDVLPVLLKRNGEVVLNAGVPVFMRGVTRSLGQMESLEFEVVTHQFRKTDILLLVSDGVTKNEAFTIELPSIFNSPNVEDRLSHLVRESSSRNKDDATMIAVWRCEEDEAIVEKYNKCLANWIDFRSHGISRSPFVETMKAELPARISSDANSEVHRTLDYAKEFGINFDRDFLSSFLSLAIKQGTDRILVARLRDMIRST